MFSIDDIVAKMLGIPTLEMPVGLMKRLHRINDLALNAGGELTSRQVIAAEIARWEEGNEPPHA